MAKIAACGALLAGGQSTRMGTNKAFLQWQGQPLIARSAQNFAEWFEQVVIVTNTPDQYAFLGLPIVSDRVPGRGPLGGIESALNGSRHEAVFCAACDMPFLNGGLIRYLVQLLRDCDLVVPVLGGRLETLHTVYSRSCLPHIVAQIDSGEYKVARWFDHVRVRKVAEAALRQFGNPQRLFFNCNTPADLALARNWAEEG